jgi:hypothetical protein
MIKWQVYTLGITMSKMLAILAWCASNAISLGSEVVPPAAIQSWKLAKERLSVFQIEYEHTSNKVRGNVYMAGQGVLLKMEMRHASEKGEKSIVLQNRHKYAINQRNGVSQLNRVLQPDEHMPQLAGIAYAVHAGISFYGGPTLDEVVTSKNFSVVDWKDQVSYEGRNFAYCSVECVHHEPKSCKSMEFWLNSHKNYRIEYAKAIQMRDGEPLRGSLRYSYSDREGLWDIVPEKRVVEWNSTILGDHHESSVVTRASNQLLPEAEFSLSHYGLPDYSPPTSVARYWWMAGILVIMAGILLFGQRFIRKAD